MLTLGGLEKGKVVRGTREYRRGDSDPQKSAEVILGEADRCLMNPMLVVSGQERLTLKGRI